MVKKINIFNSSCNCNSSIFTVISGSYKKHLKEISLLKDFLERNNIAVLSPQGRNAVNPHDEFIILDSDVIDNPRILQDSVFAKIRRSTFLIVANINEYIGKAAVMEIGYAIALGIPIYTIEPVNDPNLRPYCMPLETVFPHVKELFEVKKLKKQIVYNI